MTVKIIPEEEHEKLELPDIQGLVVRGYGQLDGARFLLLAVKDAAKARAYLRKLHPDTAEARGDKCKHAIQIAFTAPGLAALGMPHTAWETFSREFREGMDEATRSAVLGDEYGNAPEYWRWGQKAKPAIHALLMVYATPGELDDRVRDEKKEYDGGFELVHEHETIRLTKDRKEHFGWRDGLSLPVLEGVKDDGSRTKKPAPSWTHAIRPGEFILGYKNEYHTYNESPIADPNDDPKDLLPLAADGLMKDLGKNGTYLVYRHMQQHVKKLWGYLADKEPANPVKLGAKMVGRWPSGAPVEVNDEVDAPADTYKNTFLYSNDPDGVSCPVGSHIRRANPRDLLPSDHTSADSVEMVRKHQMIRRGRPYGEAIVAGLDPADILKTPDDEADRGLHFICLVGHIMRQFEFVQRGWLTSANFGAQFADGDPISAVRRQATTGDHNPNDQFTCPVRDGVRKKYTEMPNFTTLVGGGYFFLPGLRALAFIAREP